MHDQPTEATFSAPSDSPADLNQRVVVVRACWVLFFSCIGVAILEIVCGSLGYSALLVIDGLISAAFSAIVTTILLGIQMSRAENITQKYSYGQGKAQFLLSLISGLLFGAAGLTIFGISIKGFFRPVVIDSIVIGLSISVVASLIKSALYFYCKHISSFTSNLEFKDIRRLLGLSVASSLTVVQSYLLISYGWNSGDRFGRISISFILIFMSVLSIKSSLNGILDRRVGKDIESKIIDLVSSVEKVVKVESVRTRRAGDKIHIGVQVALDSNRSIQESDEVAVKIRSLLSTKMQQSEDSISVEFCVA